MDPDTGKYDLSGWQGRITDVYEEEGSERIVCIQWDKQTLLEMPKKFIRESIKDGYEYTEMNLGENEVELTHPRDTVQDRTEVAEALEEENYWVDFGEQGERIKKILDACPYDDFDIMTHWFEYLETNLDLPVRMKYVGNSNQSLSNGAEILLNGFIDADDMYGVIGSAIYGRQRVQVLLCDVEVLEKSKKTEALEDYIVWFANQ